MNSQIGMANSINFGVQSETYQSHDANKIIITGINSEENLKYVHEQALIIQTYINKNILFFSNLNLHFNFITNYQNEYYSNSGLAMFMSLISKLRQTPIDDKLIFCGQLDLYGNLFIKEQVDIEKLDKISKENTIIYSPFIAGLKKHILINSINELAEKFPILLKPKTSPPYDNRWSEFLKYKL